MFEKLLPLRYELTLGMLFDMKVIKFKTAIPLFQEKFAYYLGTLNKNAEVDPQNSRGTPLATALSFVDEKSLGRCFSIVLPSSVIGKGVKEVNMAIKTSWPNKDTRVRIYVHTPGQFLTKAYHTYYDLPTTEIPR